MQPGNPSHSAPVSNEKKTPWRLIAALGLIVLAVGGLALVDRWRDRPSVPAPPHEPSLALIAPPTPEAPSPAAAPAAPPPPPEIINNEKLAPPPTRPGSAVSPPNREGAPEEAGSQAKPYMVQVGVFTSPANAQALQKQLKRAGIAAHLETRVQLGPFKDRQEADKALARAKKLGINAVLVAPR